jgi:hypothetical protein
LAQLLEEAFIMGFNFNYKFFNVQILDTIFTIIIKGFAAWALILVVKNLVSNYQKGDYPGLFISALVGLAILAIIVGLNNFYSWGQTILGLFNGSGGTGGGGAQ